MERLMRRLNGSLSRSVRRSIQDVFQQSPLDLRFALQKTLDPRVTFTRASSGTFTGSDGVLQTAAVDVPRFDHNPTTGESLGLLVEEARTNLVVQSEDFGTTWTTTGLLAFGSGSTLNATTAPTGVSTADLITEDASNGNHRIVTAAISWAGNTQYTFSCFAKANGRSSISFLLGTAGNWVNSSREVQFNLSTGTISYTSGTPVTASITAFPRGWYRLTMTATTVAAPSPSSVIIQMMDSTPVAFYTGNGTSGVFLFGGMLELGAFPTSYIPTTSATVTRAADVANITGANFSSWYNQTAGSVFVSSSLLANVNTYEASFTDNTNDNHHALRYLATQHQLISTAGGTTNSNIFSDGGGSQLSARTAYAYGSNAYSISSNGLLGSFSSTTGGIPSTVNRLNIGYSQVSGATGNLTIKRLTYWPTRLSNTTLQQITQP
jgi:hypothetical protein